MAIRIIEWVDSVPPRRNFTVANNHARRKSAGQRLADELRKHPDTWALIDVVPAKQARTRQGTLRSQARTYGFLVVQRQTEDLKQVRFYGKAKPNTNGL